MTTAVDTLRADRTALLEIGAQLTDAQWQAGSGCPGWSVKDVVSHLSALYWLATDPAALPDTAGLPTEQTKGKVADPSGNVIEFKTYRDVSAALEMSSHSYPEAVAHGN